ncbi:MAG: SDR family NAD(P)-dependent oxidoreductase [Propionibacteriaceae bacterium]|jgi:short-subunit dehydrogenase|nr:SDR family NAD(P)-dependent oxidoreductase [Propionibacteriaceae bacterium]
MPRALITGGTVGIGRAFADALAARGYDLVLASRDQAKLQASASRLHDHYHVQVEVIPSDLTDPTAVDRLAQRLEDSTAPIDLLINNAGFAVHQSLLSRDLTLQRDAMQVMCWAVLQLSGAAARAMKERGHGAILNVTSSSAVITTGNYSAIKAWATVYTEALSNELRGSGVKVMALLPGWVKTEFHSRAGVKAHNLPDFVWVDVDQLVHQALRDLDSGRVLSVPTARWAFAVWLGHVAPRRAIRAVSRALSRSRGE